MEIKFKNFRLRWPGQQAPLLDIPDWKIERGSRLLIWGESGKGKTTLLHCMGGLLDATHGDIIVAGRPYGVLGENQRCRLRRESVTMVFQRLNLIRHLTATENVMLGLGGARKATRRESMAALDRVGMTEAAARLAWHLSAGEQQRTAVARALARKSALILADEPTANLDTMNAVRVAEELLADAKRIESTLVVVSHDERIRPLFDLIYNIGDL